jgi:CopG antitoxin of type II toxin-antitoxin system
MLKGMILRRPIAIQMLRRMNARDNRTMGMAIPEFRNEDDEFEFWSKADSTQYLDWSDASRVDLLALKPAFLLNRAMEKQRKICRSHES